MGQHVSWVRQKELMSPSHKSAFGLDIEGLRAVAVLIVLIFHTGLPLHGGYVGGDVFFVISGFQIATLLLREVQRRSRPSATRVKPSL